jgi:hypothetical protein
MISLSKMNNHERKQLEISDAYRATQNPKQLGDLKILSLSIRPIDL